MATLTTLSINTRREESLEEITDRVQQVVRESGVREGLCLVYVPHTTAGVLVNENADPTVAADMLAGLARIVPASAPYRHAEGNSPAHIKASLIGTSQTFIIHEGSLVLGTWQGIYLAEFDGPRTRRVHISCLPSVKAENA